MGEGGECQQPRDPEAAGTPQCDAKGRPPAPSTHASLPGAFTSQVTGGPRRHRAQRQPWPQIPQGTPGKMAASPQGQGNSGPPARGGEGRQGLMAAGPRRHSPHGGPAAQAAAWRRRRGRYPPSGLLIRLIAGCLPPSLMRAGALGPRPSPYPALRAPAPPPRPPRPCRLGSGGASGPVNAPPGGEPCAGCGAQLRPAHQDHLGHQRPSGESGAEATRPADRPTSLSRPGRRGAAEAGPHLPAAPAGNGAAAPVAPPAAGTGPPLGSRFPSAPWGVSAGGAVPRKAPALPRSAGVGAGEPVSEGGEAWPPQAGRGNVPGTP